MFALLESSPAPRLVLTLDVPKSFEQLVYFVRDPNKFVTKDNIVDVVQLGLLRGGDALHSLLRSMHGLYVPVVVGATQWPEAVKADFQAQMHKFMANLTETVYEVKGKTIMYIPEENITVGGQCKGHRAALSSCLNVGQTLHAHGTHTCPWCN